MCVVKTATVVALLIAFAGSSTHADAQSLVTHRIPAALALEAVGEAVAVCAKQGFAVTATVINRDGVRVAMLSGDQAGLHTQEASYSKAYAADSLAPIWKVDSSRALGEMVQAGTLRGEPPGMALRGGGLTIKFGDEVIGAIGVGGSPGTNFDEGCARAGLDKIRDRIK
jgi:uncharacterized protein GlcG (DUF336 family)